MAGPQRMGVGKKSVAQKEHATNVPPRVGLRRSARLTPTKEVGSFQLRDEDESPHEEASPQSAVGQAIRAKRLLDLSPRMPSSPETHPLTIDGLTSNSQSLGQSGSASRVVRGITRCLRDAKRRQQGKEIIIEVDEATGRIVSEDSQYIITKTGCMDREYAKFDGTTWKYQHKTIKESITNKCTENSNYDGSHSEATALHKQLGSCHKNKQYKLHLHYKKFSSKEEASKNCPKHFENNDYWVKLSTKRRKRTII